MVIHIVKPGDTPYSIARQYGVSPDMLINDNELYTQPHLVVGQAIVVQFPEETHVVRPGETLLSIAESYGVSVNQLFRNNPVLNGRPQIVAGQTLVITYDRQIEGTMQVYGYVYPFVNRDLLRKTLPYLTYLSPFTYGIRPDGSLLDLDDTELIALSYEYGAAPLMHLSTLTETGGFSNEISSIVLNDMQVQENLIQNTLETMRRKGYYGMDIDFEFVFPRERDLYTAFIANMTNALNPEGYEVIVALAPKSSGDQPGLLYEAHDYGGLGNVANAVLLMTYEWGYTYGPPLAVAPINLVRDVVDYAVSVIRRDKIFLGIPNYGYVWRLPYVEGASRAQSISNQFAVAIAAQNNAEIQYDETAQSPFFNFTRGGVRYEVWFEDARSIRAKLALVPEYGLRGVGYWNLMRPFPQNWLVLNSLYNIERIF